MTTTPLLQVHGLTVRRAGVETVRDAALTVAPGEFVGLIGPNGAGKTTLLRAALGLLPHSGRSSLSDLPLAQRARAAAFLPQSRDIAWPVPVRQLVALGQTGRDDPGAVERAIQRMGIADLADRPATGLSGGEQARALIARALAQDTPLLVADEPAAGLDPEAQLRSMGLFCDLAAEGRGVLASIHDLGLAARFCDRLVVMARGQVVAEGAPRAVLTDDLLGRVFGIRAWRADTPQGPVIQPMAVIR